MDSVSSGGKFLSVPNRAPIISRLSLSLSDRSVTDPHHIYPLDVRQIHCSGWWCTLGPSESANISISYPRISAYFTEATFLAKSSSQGNTTCTSMKMFSAIQIQIQTRLLTPTKNEKIFGQNILIWIMRNIHLIVRNICLYKLSSVVAESLWNTSGDIATIGE